MNEASAMRAEITAVREVGGDSSPQTDSRKTNKWATQGLMPSSRKGPTMTMAFFGGHYEDDTGVVSRPLVRRT